MPADTTALPWIRSGRIQSIRALRGPPLPRGASPSAVIIYDDDGNLHLRVVYDRPLGRVPIPRGVAPGTSSFGDALEPLILDQLARLTGQNFLPKRFRPFGSGARAQGEISPTVGRWADRARRQAIAWNAQGRGLKPNREGWINSQTGKMLRRFKALSIPEIDVIIGALTALEGAVGKEPQVVRDFRAAARSRLGMP
jgi:hypothetical protein